MDLKDVVKKYMEDGEEAFRALNAGHPETAEILLKKNEELIKQYFEGKTPWAGDVTESATSEKPAETQTEKPDEVPGAQIRPAAIVPEQLAQPAEHVPESQQETR